MEKGKSKLKFWVCLEASEGCFSDIRGPFRTKIPKHIKQIVRTRIVHTSGTFLYFKFVFVKTTFKPCSHIELNTQNPNTIFKITIYCTKYTKNAKIHPMFWKIWEKIDKMKNEYFSNKSKNLVFWNVFWHLGSILYNKLLFWISYSDSVYLTLYGNMV